VTPPYIHDFGSILRFAEWNFGMPYIDSPDKIYADYSAPDNNNPPGNVPLSEFFRSYRDFTSIQTSVPYTCFQYPSEEACFGPSWAPSPLDSY
jgi:hypothetical protein